MYECFHCCCRSLIWDSDFTYEDVGLEGEGIVQFLHCTNCGAHVEYYIDLGGLDYEEDSEHVDS